MAKENDLDTILHRYKLVRDEVQRLGDKDQLLQAIRCYEGVTAWLLLWAALRT